MSRLFILTAGIVLVLTGALKVASALWAPPVLGLIDPVIGLKSSYVFWGAGLFEFSVGAYVLGSSRRDISSISIALIGAEFLIYRLFYRIIDNTKPCSCLGTATDWLKIDPKLASNIAFTIACVLLVGGWWSWIDIRKPNKSSTVT